MMPHNEDKQAWCDVGQAAEVKFAGPLFSGVSILQNPAKSFDKYTHDFYMMMPCDLKTIRTRFNTSDKYGIPPFTAFTLNKKDVDRYSEKYPHIIIIFDIDYGDYKTLRYATLREIQRTIGLGKAKLHTYLHRVGDNSGNAKESWVMDSKWFKKLE
jgi:hypothetical protein